MASTDGEPSRQDVLYMLNHVFLPPKLPQADDSKLEHDIALCEFSYRASVDFQGLLPEDQQQQWSSIVRMLEMLLESTIRLDRATLQQDILNLDEGDVIALRIRAQNAALIIRRRKDAMTFESFEVQPLPGAVMQTEGKLICTYPGPAVELPLEIAQDPSFVENLASFLVQMDVDDLPDAQPTTVKAKSKVIESRSTAHPRYITQLLSMILLGIGKEAEVDRIAKRIADDVCWQDARDPWRRSPLWLVIRVAIQTTAASREIYKLFMIFLQMKLLRLFLKYDVSSELLFVTRAKTSRRVYKLGDAAEPLLDSMKALSEDIEVVLQQRWSAEQQRQADSPEFTPDPTKFYDHTALSLTKSRSYLTRVMQPPPQTRTVEEFNPPHQPRWRNISDLQDSRSSSLFPAGRDQRLALADFERLIQEQLDDWTARNLYNESAPQTLASWLKQYIGVSKVQYSSSPEDESVMLLTVLELWVALDKIVTAQCPLLSSYSPEIPTSFLDPLLLRHAKSIQRANEIQSHLYRRHANARSPTSIFSDQLAETTFSVRYFEQSAFHQDLRQEIERAASEERDKKRDELLLLNEEHSELMCEFESMECTYTILGNHKAKKCQKCKVEKRLQAMQIRVHEWPLPKREFEAKAVVFELSCPRAFAFWRSWTYHILRDIGMNTIPVQNEFEVHQFLRSYSPLQRWSSFDQDANRIVFASNAKSFHHSHYRFVRIPAGEDTVLVNNGLHFRLYDSLKGELVDPSFRIDIGQFCTFRLPAGDSPFSGLQYAISNTTHSHNVAVVDQTDCPSDVSAHEHLAFVNLRCGSRLQWMNILRELRTNVLRFSREEIHELLMQTAWQIGPLLHPESTTREWHLELTVPEFGRVFIQECDSFLSHVEANWTEGTAVKSIIYLVNRLIVAVKDDTIQDDAYGLLRKARQIVHKWMGEIVNRLERSVDDDEASLLARRACEMGALCRSTFDVDLVHLDSLLCSEEDISDLIESAIIIHDNIPPHLGDQMIDLQRLINRDMRLSHALEKPIKQLAHFETFSRGMDAAIKRLWPGYRGSTGWRLLNGHDSQWLTTSTELFGSQAPQQLHYNILTGAFLIDGQHSRRLPAEFTEHRMYKRMFGRKTFRIVPADLPGMDYATRSTFYDHQVFFALRGSELIVRVKTPSGRDLELIPNHVIQEDFPKFLSGEYAHWMDLQSGVVAFRPLNHVWQESNHDMHLHFSAKNPSRLHLDNSGRHLLVDIRSMTFLGIATRLYALERSEYLIVAYNLDEQATGISVDLPRFRLSFLLDGTELESKNLQGMVIDRNQCTGTMIGLESQLVLRRKGADFGSRLPSRCVLIPFGDVHVALSSTRNHVRVTIDTITTFNPRVLWFKYDLDNDLGILDGSVGLTSRLYRIYLHALCSHTLPDPLTRQRGTDHALQELSAASSFSFQEVDETDLRLLQLMQKLTPLRQYYPRHKRSMQTTQWSSKLPFLSQHGNFETAVCAISQYARALSMFSKNVVKDILIDDHHRFLTARASARSHFSDGKSSQDSKDMRYLSRDWPHAADCDSKGTEALKTSRLVYAWNRGLTRRLHQSDLFEIFKRWSHMKGPAGKLSLDYSREWLELDLSQTWLCIYDRCRQGLASKFSLLFSLSALAYSIPNPQQYIPFLLAFATTPSSELPPPPFHLNYDLSDGYKPERKAIQKFVTSGRFNLNSSPSGMLSRLANETQQNFERRRRNHYNDNTESRSQRAVNDLLAQQLTRYPRSPFVESSDSQWYRTDSIMANIDSYFASCSNNADLQQFASEVVSVLQSYSAGSQQNLAQPSRFTYLSHRGYPLTVQNSRVIPSLEDRLSIAKAPLPIHPIQFPSLSGTDETRSGSNHIYRTENVKELIAQFQSHCQSTLAASYSNQVDKSRLELQGQGILTPPSLIPPTSVCLAYSDQCRRCLDIYHDSIRKALGPSDVSEEIAAIAGLWPRCDKRELISCLASMTGVSLPAEWRETLISLAMLIMACQHSERLTAFAQRGEVDNFYQELQHASFSWDDARKYPDWLLIQVQGNFITRSLQSDVAHEMISPQSGQSIVLQLNMGEGKSHVIVPLVTVALSDSTKLVRVVVSKPLSRQMFHLLVERVSGLPNRRVFYLPFSRDVTMDTENIQHIRELFEECIRVKGVLLTQPEHILSFRLMVVDRLLASSPKDQKARDLQQIHAWLASMSRDILDESDELLHVRYQLIYTSGEQQPFDGAPDRWTTSQGVLDLVRQHMQQLDTIASFQHEVELLRATGLEGEFPRVRVLGAVAAEELISRIAEDALDGKLDTLAFVGVSSGSQFRDALLTFIKKRDIEPEVFRIVESTFGQSGQWKSLLLLRGLLAHGVLTYVLGRLRWRVDYGLDPSRSLLAVPYRAKDMPSLRSEFGHPDVAICLTCLSYYYGGLTFDQVKECFDILLKTDNPLLEYERWVRRARGDLPESLRELKGVNTQDTQSFENVVPKFQHNQATINFYLANVVFPKEAKDFNFKLGTSGWDLAEKKVNVTTGFSGTNDNSDLLPTSIAPTDTVKQLATNARVLDYLLQPENERYICTQSRHANGQPCSAVELLDLISRESQEIRVLLDVGAQMLEMTNQELITHWLSLTTDKVSAGVFFDDADHLAVIGKDGAVERLYSSPFYQRLDECIVYLDDAHTRGTDLKLPRHYRAAVTLGPKVTKDRLVQGKNDDIIKHWEMNKTNLSYFKGCMRMRKLGHGQSVVFLAPPEVDRRIRDTQQLPKSGDVKVMDMLSWVMSRTCEEIENYIPHWMQQGVDYHRRKKVNLAKVSTKADIKRLKESWLQPAAQTLEQMYAPSSETSSDMAAVKEIPQMYNRLQDLGVVVVRDTRVEEEQEREVQHELEQEKHVERPRKLPAAAHRLDEEIRSLVRFGEMPSKPGILFPLLTPLKSAVTLRGQNAWADGLVCTRDFMTTTKGGKEKSELTDYMRPVQWIVSVPKDEDEGSAVFVVMSPFEVNTLLPDIRASQHVRLHMYAPRTTQVMKPLDDLMLYCIPPLSQANPVWVPPTLDVRCQLNIWSGQLYLDSYDVYLRLCLLLGISYSENAGYTDVDGDRFVPPSGRVGEMVQACVFDKSPVAVLKKLFGLRRKGMSFDLTHIGKILNARLLSQKDFEE
ncbi:hypothetical protein CVT26_010200 [Gymnopilus dilepis]|uniref:ubiquitinyl hydrolase 1 n=1 Tax=Gymnopilus dilepis TaxID=231916 RepID=A0A409W4J2_9AGAR|nr:hypothetical protein CVT26_010200 [Gymnopilus dilepis]